MASVRREFFGQMLFTGDLVILDVNGFILMVLVTLQSNFIDLGVAMLQAVSMFVTTMRAGSFGNF